MSTRFAQIFCSPILKNIYVFRIFAPENFVVCGKGDMGFFGLLLSSLLVRLEQASSKSQSSADFRFWSSHNSHLFLDFDQRQGIVLSQNQGFCAPLLHAALTVQLALENQYFITLAQDSVLCHWGFCVFLIRSQLAQLLEFDQKEEEVSLARTWDLSRRSRVLHWLHLQIESH